MMGGLGGRERKESNAHYFHVLSLHDYQLRYSSMTYILLTFLVWCMCS